MNISSKCKKGFIFKRLADVFLHVREKTSNCLSTLYLSHSRFVHLFHGNYNTTKASVLSSFSVEQTMAFSK